MASELEKARKLIQLKRNDLAEQTLRTHLAKFPEDAEALALLGSCCYRNAKLPEAKQFSESSIQKSPNLFPLPFMTLVQILIRERKFKKARKKLDQALSIFPNEYRIFTLHALVSIELKQYKVGLKWADQGLQLAPQDSHLLNAKANILSHLKKNEEAAEILDAALKVNPLDHNALFTKAWIELESKRYEKAQTLFRSALIQSPEWSEGQYGFKLSLLSKYRWFRPTLAILVYLRKYGSLIGVGLSAGLATSAGQIVESVWGDAEAIIALLFGILSGILLIWLFFIPFHFALLQFQKESKNAYLLDAESYAKAQKSLYIFFGLLTICLLYWIFIF